MILEEEILEPGQQLTLEERLDLNYIIVKPKENQIEESKL